MKKITLSVIVMLAISALLVPVASAQLQLPTISVSPGSYNFGQVPVGAVASKTFVITNSGDAPLSVSQVKTKLPFGDSETSSFTVPAHSSHSFIVAFAPSAPTSFSGYCTIASNAHNAKLVIIPLSGEGVE